MSVALLAALANAVPHPTPEAPLDGATTAFLAALAPVWPAIEPWLLVGAVVLVMGIATEIVVRELQRVSRMPGAVQGVPLARRDRLDPRR